jgi:hypothetical protein
MDSTHRYDSLFARIRTHGRQSPFPPATEDQIRETEQQLGFPLPPLLRLLYTEIANGGFGPGLGIVGTPGGFLMTNPRFDDPDHDIVQSYQQEVSEAQALIHLEDYGTIPCISEVWYKLDSGWEQRERQSYRYVLPNNTWPEYMLPLCYHGCTCFTYIDAMSGRLFDERNEYVAASLEEWFERWLTGESM